MPAINEISLNEKTLINISASNDSTWDEHTETWDENERPWDSPGKPITKTAKNNKTLSNLSENT